MNTIPVQCVSEVISCRANVTTPEVGMLGTYFIGSDRYAIVVAKVLSPKKIFILQHRINDAILAQKIVKDGIEYLPTDIVENLLNEATPTREYYDRYEDDADTIYNWDLKRFNKENIYIYRKNGRWVKAGNGLWSPGSIHLGVADPYLDPCF